MARNGAAHTLAKQSFLGVARMTRASAHGRGLSTLTQVMYATYSMETHDRRAGSLDLDTLLRDGYDRF